MKKISGLIPALLISVFSFSQSTEDSVKAVVNNLFTAMKNSDTVLLKSTFADGAIFQTIENRGGVVKVKSEAVQAFLNSIGKIQPGDADERISFGSVKTDGDLASVWTPYNFYYKLRFSHCGANSFQLVRVNGSWKIQYLIDTRRTEGCTQ